MRAISNTNTISNTNSLLVGCCTTRDQGSEIHDFVAIGMLAVIATMVVVAVVLVVLVAVLVVVG